MKNFGRGMAVVGVVFCLAMMVQLSVRGAESESEKAGAEMFRVLEREYKVELREYLEENGYRNAGVTMTHTTDGEGYREYTVAVHHDRFGRLTPEEREALLETMEDMGFGEEGCGFRVVQTF